MSSHVSIELRPGDMVAEGVERQIFVHPDDPTRLIKITKSKQSKAYKRWTFGDLTKRYFPSTRIRSIAKQHEEFLRLSLKSIYDAGTLPPIAHYYGFAQTNLGLGEVTERITNAAGENAPTLKDIHQTDAFDLDALNAFVNALYEASVCVSDLNPGNIVYGFRHTGPTGEDPEQKWVLVDGIGDRFAVPIRTLSTATRRFSIDDAFKRSKKLPGLTWNAKKRQFQRPTLT